jgi:hypothetical protein
MTTFIGKKLPFFGKRLHILAGYKEIFRTNGKKNSWYPTSSRGRPRRLSDNWDGYRGNKLNSLSVYGSVPHHERKIKHLQNTVSVRPEVSKDEAE